MNYFIAFPQFLTQFCGNVFIFLVLFLFLFSEELKHWWAAKNIKSKRYIIKEFLHLDRTANYKESFKFFSDI